MNEPEMRPPPGNVASLFGQLTLRSRQRRFAGVELARWEFQEYAMQRIAKLPLDDKAAVAENRDDEHSARMNDVFANRRLAIGQMDRVAPHVQQRTVEDLRALDPRLLQVPIRQIDTARRPRITRHRASPWQP